MSEGEHRERPHWYCTNCGAQVRSGTAFCVSCGASLTPGVEGPDQTYSGPTSAGRGSFVDSLRGRVRGVVQRIGQVFSGLDAGALRRLPARALQWFKDLPGENVPKLVLVGSVLLVLLIVLSPITFVVAALVFGVSLIALLVRVVQRRSVVGWGITAVASLVLAFALSGVSGALYGGEGTAGTGVGQGGRAQYAGDTGAHGEASSSFGGGSGAYCLDDAGPDVGPSYYEVVDSRTYEDESGATGITLVVAMDSRQYGNPWASIGELQSETASYDAVEIVTYPPNLASYDPATGEIVPGPLTPPTPKVHWHVANSAAGEALLDFPKEDLNYCGSSYESGGYRWGTS